ncbi:putative acid phosphatase [Cyberlindnera fabianii]|uniref:acid phosphatase n=1 Tax=Cyberlindnera fabianii TaxID=36022 RepID=A0A1V2L7A5_CYBFA|nr:putative acid phosphatase [Cyberlindnera fabianii]
MLKNILSLLAIGALASAKHTERLFSTIQPSNDEIDASRLTAQTNHYTSNVEGSAFNRFVVIWLENTDFDKAAESDGLHWLAQYGVTLTNYWAVTHPSEPNYAASVGGDYFGMGDDNFNRFPKNVSTVVDLLESKGITWGEYQEDMPYAGFEGFEYVNQQNGANDYVRKHNPLVLYDSVATDSDKLANIKNLTTFYEDLENETLPQWMFITPNMTSDGHDSTIDVSATWTRNFLEPLLCNEYFMKDTLVLVTFDETETYSVKNKVFALLLGGAVPEEKRGTVDSTFYQHYSEISTVEANWDLPHLGRHDVDANVFQIVADKTGVTNVDVDTTNRVNNHSYVGWITDETYDFPAPNVNAVNMNGKPILDSIKSVWESAYSSQLNATYFTATTTTSAWNVPDATVGDPDFLIQTPSPLSCAVSSVLSSEDESSSEGDSSSSTFESSSFEFPTSSEEPSSTLASESSEITSEPVSGTSISEPASQTSAIESSESSTESSASSSIIPSNSTSASASASASESTAIPSTTAAPQFSGSFNDGHPKWQLTFPGALGPWSSISLSFAKGNSSGEFDFSSAIVSVAGVVSSDASVSVNDDSVTIEVDFSIESSEELNFEISAEIVSGSAWTSNAHISLLSGDSKKFVKRAETTWNLSDTITADASSSASSASTSVSTSASDAEASNGSITTSFDSTSVVTEAEQSTTVVTITSCSNDVCSEAEITTGLTVITTTESGIVTEYTTYCPLTDSTTIGDEQSTTVVTITSCSDNACSEVPVTTGVTVITETLAGTVTEYTTYCPLSGSTEALTSKQVATKTGAAEAATETRIITGVTDSTTQTGATEAAASQTIVTKATTSTFPSTTSSEEGFSSPAVTTFEAKAAGLVTGTAFFGLLFSFLML